MDISHQINITFYVASIYHSFVSFPDTFKMVWIFVIQTLTQCVIHSNTDTVCHSFKHWHSVSFIQTLNDIVSCVIHDHINTHSLCQSVAKFRTLLYYQYYSISIRVWNVANLIPLHMVYCLSLYLIIDWVTDPSWNQSLYIYCHLLSHSVPSNVRQHRSATGFVLLKCQSVKICQSVILQNSFYYYVYKIMCFCV